MSAPPVLPTDTSPTVPARYRTTLWLPILWSVGAACFTYTLTTLNTIDCGRAPDTCEPAVEGAASVGAGCQILVGAAGLGARFLPARLRSTWVWAMVVGATLVVGLLSFRSAVAAVHSQ